MNTLPLTHAEEQLTSLGQQFVQWRQSRTTARGRIPQPLWMQAVALSSVLPLTRVAKQLGLTPQARKRRREATRSALAPTPPLHAPHFVEISAARHTPVTEVEIQRPDGAYRRILYHEASPLLAPLLQPFLEPRCCFNLLLRAVSFWPCSPSTFARA